MLDFTAVNAKTQTLLELAQPLTQTDLVRLTNEMLDTVEGIIADATDADVVFIPLDPAAKDTFGKAEDAELAWTLGHVVVHATATAEEGAAHATNLARGLVIEGRSRYETEWQTVTTIAQVRQRLAESRRMRLGFLAAWPDAPHLEIIQEHPFFGQMNATARYIAGMMHEDAHLAQLREIMRQAQAARGAA